MPKKKPAPFLPIITSILVLILAIIVFFTWSLAKKQESQEPPTEAPEQVQIAEPINLPKPAASSRMSVETALFNRRSRRNFTDSSLTLKQVGQILWAAQGVTVNWGGRTAPTTKSVYPLTVYLAAHKIDGISEGIYKYIPGEREAIHQVALIKPGNFKEDLGEAVGQNAAKEAPSLLFIAGDFDKMAKAHEGERMDANVYLEAGHAAQNIYLQAESLSLGTVAISSFDALKLASILNLPANESIIYAIPVGIPKR
ncbi:SagB/ThcOx family dehydrogenase [Candidatus Collierbacteria bacterium]|nr:SagB/ThcOx family dehydrogenase [Candidatus Collierbacteria bacterium]